MSADQDQDQDLASITLPEGVAREDVVIESEVDAFVRAETESNPRERGRPFNPQNGRYYNEHDPGCANYNSTTAVAGVQVNCAYDDCDGFTTVVMEDTVDDRCSECGEAQMGRVQFSSAARNRRANQRGVRDRTVSLRDEFSKEMARLTSAGVGAIAAMDYLMCSVGEIPYEEWAEARDVSDRAVRRNMKNVATAVGETVHYSSRGY